MKILRRLAMLSLLLSFSSINATTIQSLNFEQRTLRSDRIVIGEVQSVRYEKASTIERIYTVTTIKVIESLKGTAKRNMLLTIRQIGGQIGEWSQFVSGDAKFEANEEVLVFLRHDPRDDLHFLVGMGQGKLTVDLGTDQLGKPVPDKAVRTLHVHRPSSKNSRQNTLTLSQLRERIQRWLQTAQE